MDPGESQCEPNTSPGHDNLKIQEENAFLLLWEGDLPLAV
jgi:hypothetical protein